MRLALETMIAWTGDHDWLTTAAATRGQITIGPWPDRARWSDAYFSTTGACNMHWHRRDWDGRKAMLFIEAMHIAITSGIPPADIHRAFLGIAEYVDGCAEDLPGVTHDMLDEAEEIRKALERAPRRRPA